MAARLPTEIVLGNKFRKVVQRYGIHFRGKIMTSAQVNRLKRMMRREFNRLLDDLKYTVRD